MNWKSLALACIVTASGIAYAETPAASADNELVTLSKQKWLWMAERNAGALEKLIHKDAIFVHMSRSLSKTDELGVIASGNIQYKQADIENISAKVVGNTAIVLSNIQLFAIVRDAEARNPFTVTETFVKENGEWKLLALAFTRRVTPQ